MLFVIIPQIKQAISRAAAVAATFAGFSLISKCNILFLSLYRHLSSYAITAFKSIFQAVHCYHIFIKSLFKIAILKG